MDNFSERAITEDLDRMQSLAIAELKQCLKRDGASILDLCIIFDITKIDSDSIVDELKVSLESSTLWESHMKRSLSSFKSWLLTESCSRSLTFETFCRVVTLTTTISSSYLDTFGLV